MDIERKIYAISDLHVDHRDNLDFVSAWSDDFYADDVLLVAGDVTDNLSLLEQTLAHLTDKFWRVFFVPGNHDLWIKQRDYHVTSIDKFHHILQVCDSINVGTRPEKVQLTATEHVWVVPLMSWYATPEEDREDSLFHPGSKHANGEDNQMMWMDNQLCKWPQLHGISKSQYFAVQNQNAIYQTYDAPVISFSHFVPRQDLIPSNIEEQRLATEERTRMRLHGPLIAPAAQFAPVVFNFTRYAGCKILDRQIRQIGSTIHVYGHQHRNRDRVIDGVRYVSHCLGTRKERQQGFVWGVSEWDGPKQVWPN